MIALRRAAESLRFQDIAANGILSVTPPAREGPIRWLAVDGKAITHARRNESALHRNRLMLLKPQLSYWCGINRSHRRVSLRREGRKPGGCGAGSNCRSTG